MSETEFAGWSAYRASLVDVDLGDKVVTLGPEGVVKGERWKPAQPVYVITAYNPGRHRDAAGNEAAQTLLIELLAQREISWLPATGRSRDGSWQEPSVAVLEVSEPDALAIGRDFDQDAVFRWDGRALDVLPCAQAAN